ncbi:hypothetical protein N7495_005567 [Penicillium taxi]|uniref:uncharacterized protein n=1 Tax=Penicillium taxi TaxID=168475 RepID=UPI002545BBA1|nr:uncharacterized protein N7495_005567 [Penicillium taxi]KAJ5893876.1 hypothetical protein N7495_005567 [Penicillium taxi]
MGDLGNKANNVVLNDATKPMPIAIVGMACRLPGQVRNLEDFWELCARGRSGWSEIPSSRFNAAGFYHPDPDRTGCFNPKGGHFLDEDVSLFDALFFNITIKEAHSMDPQQRLLLECTYEALENGGITKQSLQGRDVGVFVGGSQSDYEIHMLRDPTTVPMHEATGCALSLQSNRISYYFDLKGPSVTVDTACSSSLTALHLACQSLRAKECSAALVGGCRLDLVPDTFVSMSASRLFSESGKSYPFDQQAKNQTVTGYGRGEAIGCLVLKPLHEAVAAGDPIRSVIVNTGVNQDGRTIGITMPNGESQKALMRAVYRQAMINPLEAGYIEAHGTGTGVGDPIEAASLHDVFCEYRPRHEPLLLGSVKSNVGHSEGASGLIGTIKTALMLERGFVLPNCRFQTPREDIPMKEWGMKVPNKLSPWPKGKQFASINNFGFGGTNAHIVLEKAPKAQLVENGQVDDEGRENNPTRYVYVLSGHNKKAAKAQSKLLAEYLEKHPDAFDANLMSNLAYTLGQRRTIFPWKLAVSALSCKELIGHLSTDLKPLNVSERLSVSLIFTGQGAQWIGMGMGLIKSRSKFSETLQAVDKALKDLGSDFLITDELEKDEASSSLHEPYVSQPACTAIQLALVDLLHSWNIFPEAVIGHSSGEIAAAYAAGILGLEQCIRIAYFRGATAQILKNDTAGCKGMMMVAGASPARLQPLIDEIAVEKVRIACINSDSSVTLSGDADAIDKLESTLASKEIFTRKIKTGVAYHSHHMLSVAKKYRELMGDIVPGPSMITFHSTVHGKEIPSSYLTSDYWVNNLVSPVLFLDGLKSLISQTTSNNHILIEVGPHSAMQSPIQATIKQHFPENKSQYFAAMKRNSDLKEVIQDLAAALFVRGAEIDLDAINVFSESEKQPKVLTNLPSYPWDHTTRHWHNSRIAQNLCHPKFPRNDILGELCADNIDLEPRWRNVIRTDDHPWIRQHKVHGNSLYPMTAFLAMAIEGVVQLAHLQHIKLDRVELRDVRMQRMLVVPDTSSVEVFLSMKLHNGLASSMSNGAWYEFKAYSWAEGRGWDEHCHGFVIARSSEGLNPVNQKITADSEKLLSISQDCTKPVDASMVYDSIAATSVNYGPLFRNLTGITVSEDGKVTADACIPDTKSCMSFQHETDFLVHPITLDTVLQSFWFLIGYDKPGPHSAYLADSIKHMTIKLNELLTSGTTFKLFAVQEPNFTPGGDETFDVFGVVEEENPWISVSGFKAVRINDAPDTLDGKVERALCYKEELKPCLDLLEISGTTLRQISARSISSSLERVRLLEKVSRHFINRALSKVPSELPSFQPHYRSLYRWMQTVRSSSDTKCDDELIRSVRSMSASGEMTCKIGELLPEILLGKIDPLSAIVEDNLLNQYYENHDSFPQICQRISLCIDIMANQNPNMNILEIGAGTGSVTWPILESFGGRDGKTLPRFCHYTFTDISTGFLERAHERLRGWGSLVSYQSLDISEDPVSQGYTAHSYDLVIAGDVFHATARISETLANAHKLLKPGGKLLFVEETNMHPRVFPFACLPGWWLCQDERTIGPLLDQEAWNRALRENGFSGVDLYLQDFPDCPEASSSVIISTANTDMLSKHEVVIIGHGQGGVIVPSDLVISIGSVARVSPNIKDLIHADVAGKVCVFIGEVGQALLPDLASEVFLAIQRVVKTAKGILWVTGHHESYLQQADVKMILGLARTVRNETRFPFVTLDLGKIDDLRSDDAVHSVVRVLDKVFQSPSILMTGEMEFKFQDGEICIPRVVEDHAMNFNIMLEGMKAPPQLQEFQQNARPLTLKLTNTNALDGFLFTDDDSLSAPLPSDFIEIKVCFSGLNFRDIMVIMGEVTGSNVGGECSGIVTAVGSDVPGFDIGDRVCAVSHMGSFASYIRCPETSAWKLPPEIALDVAATIPITFCTAYYSLVDVARLLPGESILIHSAAGGLGQAAILLAQSLGANVFATVSTREKKEFLQEAYSLDEDRIFFSRDTNFAQAIFQATDGQGIDVVVNSLSGDYLRASFETLAPFGRFVELGKRDFLQNSRLEMAHFLNNVTFASVDLVLVMKRKPQLLKRLLGDVFEKFGGDVFCKPTWPITSYSISDTENALREMRTGKMIGKIVIQMNADAIVKVHPPRRRSDTLLRHDASYLIVGGTRGVGLNVATWLASRGARYLVLVSRSGQVSKESQPIIDKLISQGVSVKVCQCDVRSEEIVKKELGDILATMPNLRGVIYSAMVVRDVMFEEMEYSDYHAVTQPRVQGVWNLYNGLVQFNQKLDFLINFSSLSGIIGNFTQSAYAASCTFMDEFSHSMNAIGVPCTTIDLPPVSGIGYLTQYDETREMVRQLFGDEWVTAEEIHSLLAIAIRGFMKDSCNDHCITGMRGIKKQYENTDHPWTRDPRFSQLVRLYTMSTTSEKSSQSKDGAFERPAKAIQQVQNATQARQIVADSVLGKLSSLLMIAMEELDASKPISVLGLDSLVAIEIRHWITREFDANLQLLEILASDSVNALANTILQKSGFVSEALKSFTTAEKAELTT